jgi:hypothetical protein
MISASKAYYIKLGRGGEWETDCFNSGNLRLGYRETPHDLCLMGEWEKVRDFWADRRKDRGTPTRDTNQIRSFYEADEHTLFITFANGLLYWCQPTGGVTVLPDLSRTRPTVDGWHTRSIGGTVLSSDRISGNLLKVQMFQGTICKVEQLAYLLRKLNDQLSPELKAAEEAERAMTDAVVGLMRLLTWQDFELLVDLIFSASGWRRVGVVGRMQKTVDLELVLPTTGERALVQIKSQANANNLRDYAKRFDQSDLYDRMFFVWHSGSVPLSVATDGITLVGAERLAQMCIDAGLASWLREKVS